MNDSVPWAPLCRCGDAKLARTIVTTIAAMEFDVRLRDAASNSVIEDLEDLEDPDAGPFLVEVHREDADALGRVLDELVEEQDEFDRFLDQRDRAVMSAQRLFLILVIVIVAILAVFGLIEL
jgi:hypothetical protein